jgi:DNA polymerase III sliding clamp (beta) subunit (PCNA family)
MKVQFNTNEMKQRLAQLAAVIANKSEEPLYKCVRVFQSGSAVVLQGIDVDTTMTVRLADAKVLNDESVNVLLEFAALNSHVQFFDQATFELATVGENEAVIKSGRYRGRLTTWPTDAFITNPLVSGLDSKERLNTYEFGLPGLVEQIEQVDFAVPQADGKFVVPSVLFSSSSGELTLVATDGKVMAISSMPNSGPDFTFTLPKPALELIKRLTYTKEASTVSISDTEGTFFFETATELVTYNKTHAEFPPYQKIIPASGSHPVVVIIKDRDELVHLLKRIEADCPDKDEHGAIFSFKENTVLEVVAVKTEKRATGDVCSDMGFDSLSVTGQSAPMAVKLDIKRILPWFERATFPVAVYLKTANIVVDMHGNGGSPEKPVFRFLIMPMRGVEGISSIPLPAEKQ